VIRERLEALPLRVRLVLILTGLTAVGLILSGTTTALLMRDDLVSGVDAELRSAGLVVAQAQINDLDNRTPTPYSVFVAQAATNWEPRELVASRLTTAEPLLPAMPPDSTAVTAQQPFTIESTDDEHRWRAIAGPIRNANATYVIATPLDRVAHTTGQLVLLTSLIGVGVLAAVMLLGWYLVRRAMRPLTQIEDTASAIADGDLTRRIPMHAAEDEIHSLTDSLNRMLGQIERSFAIREASEERMREFVADASHELRTPLATVRGYAELHRQGALANAEAAGTAFGRIESEATRMTALVDDLLTLARLDARPERRTADVDLTVLAADAVQDGRAQAPDREIRLVGRSGPVAPAVVRGEEAALRQVLANLVRNAITHTPAGTPIEVAVGPETDDQVIVEVRDRGPGIPEEAARKIFERFYRVDRGRSRASGGTGLGLAIVAAIVEQHGGRVGLVPRAGGGTTFLVALPTADSQVPHTTG
jgi:two-component system OmpR family sensor kinase